MHKDIWLYIAIITFFGLLGWSIDYPLEATLLAALGVIAWLMYSITKLQRWIDDPKQHAFNREFGQTYRIYRQILRNNQQNQRRKRKLTSLITEFRHAVSALPDAVILIDQAGKINWANPNAKKLLGIAWPEDTGVRFNDLIRQPEIEKLLDDSFDSGDRNKQELPSVEIKSRLNNEITLSVKCVRYAKQMTMIVARDVSNLIKVNQIHTDFVTNVSHELKTPLTVLKGYVEILNDSEKLPSQFKKPLKQMNLQGIRMQLIVNDLLYLARLENTDSQGVDELVDVTTLVNAVIESLQTIIEEKRHHLELDLAPDLLIKGSQTELHSAFSNLITNAIHYTPDEGSIKIEWGAIDNNVEFNVIDNGPGIAAHHLERLTQRFYRINKDRSREGGGTGLGLAIVKHVLQRHDSELVIESKENEGSRFSCRFNKQRVEAKGTKNSLHVA